MIVRVGSFFVVLSILALACGSFGEDGDEPRPLQERERDAGRADADANGVILDTTTTEPPNAAPRCSETGAFGTPNDFTGLTASKPIEGVRLSADELTAYFWIDILDGEPRDHDLYFAERSSTKGVWGAPTALETLNKAGVDDAYITVTDDGKTAYFARGEVSKRQLLRATRPSGRGQFGDPEPFEPISPNADASDDSSPWVTPDGGALFLSSRGRSPYATSLQIFRLEPASTPPVLTPVVPVNTDGIDSNPVLTGDGRTMYLKSGGSGSDDTDLYMARWDDAASAFGKPVKLDALSTPDQQDFPLWVSRDGCILYYRNGDQIKVVKRD